MHLSSLVIWIAIACAGFGTIINPLIGVVTYYVLSFWRPQDIYHWSLSGSRMSYIIALITIISFIIHRDKRSTTKETIKSEGYLMFLFWIAVFISYLASPVKLISWPIFLVFSKIVLFFYIASMIVTDMKKMRVMMWIPVICFGILAIRGNYQYFFEGYHNIEGPGLGGATYRDNNTFAMLFVLAIPYCFYLPFVEKKLYIKIALWAMVPVMIHAVILTYSRGGFLGMAMVLAISALLTRKKWVGIFLGTLMLLAVLRLWGVESHERIGTVFVDPEERDASTKGRIEAWKAGYKMMMAHPLTGVGLNNFERVAKYYNPHSAARVAHNTYLQIGGEAGIIAFAALIILVVISVYDMYKIHLKTRKIPESDSIFNYSTILFISMCGYIVCSMFLSLELLEPFYYNICLIMILKRIYLDEQIKHED
ncbi:O-antigen ligase family protein [Chlamydiota bacterium]